MSQTKFSHQNFNVENSKVVMSSLCCATKSNGYVTTPKKEIVLPVINHLAAT